MASHEEEPAPSKLYYPVGNTPPTDVTLGCIVARQCDILLLGCGDIRNVLYTTHALQENGTLSSLYQNAPDVFSFHLNDNENGIIARDLILFNIVKTVNPDDEADMKFLWSVWYDVLMSREHYDHLKGVMNNLTKNASGDQNVYFGNVGTEQSVKNCLWSWAKDQHGADEILRKRRQFLKVKYSEKPEDHSTERLASRLVHQFQCFAEERLTDRYDGAKMTQVKICFEQLRQWVKSFHAAEKRCKIQIHLWLDHARTLCQLNLPEDLGFDFIDTSNLADDLGVIPVLVFCHEKLKEDGVVRIETFDYCKCLSHGEHFHRLCIDIPFLMYPTVLGFHLAEEFKVGRESMPEIGDFEGVDKLVFRWKKAASFTPCTLTGADAISMCLERIQSPKPLQSKEVFQKVKPALFDDETKSKITDRLKKMTIEQAARDHIGNAKVLVSTLLSTTHFSTTLRFSCPVSIEDSTITYSRKKGLITGTLVRYQHVSVGECVLPWKLLTTSDISELPDYPTSSFSLTALNRKIVWVFPNSEHVHSSDLDKPDPRHQLQDILAFLFVIAHVKEKTRLVTVPRRNPEGNTPLGTYQSYLVLEGHKLWEGNATTFVTVYNHDAASRLVRQGKLTLSEFMVDVGDVSWAQTLYEELLQGYDILAEILEINSYRLRQNSAKAKWKMRSFIRTRYPFKSGKWHFKESDMSVKYTEGGVWQDPSAMMRCMQECQEDFQQELFSSPEVRKADEAIKATYKPICGFCGKMTDCKRCTACDNAFYCSRDCQKRAWHHHKRQCRKFQF